MSPTLVCGGLMGASVALWLAAADGTPARPNPALTPGAISGAGVEQICSPGYSGAHRLAFGSGEEYRRYVRVMNAYGIPKARWHEYTMDHLVPLELGGADTEKNLWPQPRQLALDKDEREHAFHRWVCRADGIDLAHAQRYFLDWGKR